MGMHCVVGVLVPMSLINVLLYITCTMPTPLRTPPETSIYAFVTIPPGQNTSDPSNRFARALRQWRDVMASTGGALVMYDTRDGSVHDFATATGIRHMTPPVSMTWDNLPRYDSMMIVAHEWTRNHGGDVAVLVNADVEPEEDVADTLRWLCGLSNRLQTEPVVATQFGVYRASNETTPAWFAVAPRVDLYHGGPIRKIHDRGGYDLWAWSVNAPLESGDGVIPPFRKGRSMYDNWMLNDLLTSGKRHVVDLSACMTISHQVHPRMFGSSGDWYDSIKRKGDANAYINRHMAFEGGYVTSLGTWCETPWVCRRGHSLQRRTVRSNVQCTQRNNQFTSCDADVDSPACQEDIHARTRRARALTVELPDGQKLNVRSSIYATAKRTWPYSMRRQIMRRSSADGILLLTAFNQGYAIMALNFKCTMDRHRVDTYTMAALDVGAYEYGVLHGLPVFDAYTNLAQREETGAARYGTKEFKSITKSKSAVVLMVLKMNISVIFSDVDIGWVTSPILVLAPYTAHRHTLHIQSNAPMVRRKDGSTTARAPNGNDVQDEPPLGYRRLNSGLYVAPASAAMIRAFTRIVHRASISTLSEQPAFYDELCPYGERAGECHGADVSVRSLDRLMYRHGAVIVGDNESTFVAFHPNWRSGEDSKRTALEDWNMWHVESDRFCK